jgi:hypothetical protein
VKTQFSLLFLMALSAFADGGPGMALHFDGIDDYVSVPPASALNPFPLTLTTWVRTSQTNGGGALFFKQQLPTLAAYWVLSLGNGVLSAEMAHGSGQLDVFGSGRLADGKWHHVAFTADNSGGKIFVDGALDGVGMWNGTSGSGPAGGELDLGLPSFSGEMDEVALWSGALPQSQIQANKNRRLTGNEPGLVAYYRCDEASGTNLIDSSPNGGNNDGTLQGGMGFTTSGILPFSPAAETLPGSIVGAGSVSLKGAGNPEGTNSSAWFEWGTTTNYGTVTPAQSIGSGSAYTNFSQNISGLAAGVAYQYRTVVSNSLGVASGINVSISLPLPPILLPPSLAGSNVVLTWTAQSNTNYRLEFNPDLAPSNWNALPGDVLGLSNIASKFDAQTPSNRLYRVRVLP